MKTLLGILLAVVVLSTAAAVAPSRSHAAAGSCPVPDSGTCLGVLTAGTYSSTSFLPTLTFTVPTGWANYLDISGLYLLQPPGAKPPGNYIAGSFIGLETSVAPEAGDCRSRVHGVKKTPTAIAAWIATRKGLVVTNRHDITLGGLQGVVLDVRMRNHAKGCYASGAPTKAVPLLVGSGPSSFDHEVAPRVAERHWLLAYGGGTLDIAVVDASGGKSLASYAAIVSTFQFALS